MWLSLIVLVIGFILQELLRPKVRLEDAKPAGLGDFKFPTATEGRVEPVVFGRCMVEGPNVVWYGDVLQAPISKYIRQNLWSGKRVTLGFKYYVGVQAALCRGPVDAFHKMFIGDRQIFNTTMTINSTATFRDDEFYGGDSTGTGGVYLNIDVHLGASSQTANAYLARFQAPGGDIALQSTYAGSCYIVARNVLPIVVVDGVPQPSVGGSYIGNTTSVSPWKFEVARFPALFSGQTAGQNKIGAADANPVNVIYELLTDAEWGFGYLAADVDVGPTGSFKAASDTLIAEGNGFAYLLTSLQEAGDLLHELERQIDGVVFLDHVTGKWQIKLARADYDIDTVPELNPSNIVDVSNFSQGTWAGTANHVKLEFTNRANDYKVSTAFAVDTANMLMQGGGSFSTLKIVPINPKFPGVMDAANAAKLASRELRANTFPLATATVSVTRALYALTVGSVVALTLPTLGIVKLGMRITKIDFGQLDDNKITLQLTQDVFSYFSASFGAPPVTGWTFPVSTLSAYATADQLAFEAPRAILVRDPDFNDDDTVAKILAAVRLRSNEIAVEISQRNAAGAPAGAFVKAGDVYGFMLVGKLRNALNAGVANPTASILIEANPNAQEQIEEAFDDATTLAEMGGSLVQLILVGTEFMLVRTAANSGADVALQTVYRGVLDSAQIAHAAGTLVYLLFVGSGLSDGAYPNTNQCDVQLRPQTASTVFAGAPTTINFTFAKRVLRPYPPAAPLYNGSGTAFTTPSLEGAGSGIGGFRIDVAWWRRNYTTLDEVLEVTRDNTVDASTEYRLELRADPLGANTLVGALSAWTTGSGPLAVSRADILTAAPAGTLLRVLIRARHAIGAEVDLESRYDMRHDVTPTSTLTGFFYFGGGVAVNIATASYTAVATGTFSVAIGAAQATAAIQVSINAGAFVTVVAAAATSGTFSATSSDTIRLRRTVNEAPQPNYVELRNPSASVVAYGTFKN